jgi:hypothetical protein
MEKDKELEKYLEICELRNKEYLKIYKQEAEKAQKKIEELSKELMLTIRSKSDAESQIFGFENKITETRQKYTDEFKAFKSLECYEKIELSELNGQPAFEGLTKPIIIDKDGTQYKMGKYKVIIQNGFVKINQPRNTNSVIHPHVKDGIPCLGDLSQSIPKLLANYEYALVFDIIHKYLSSYNENSAYLKIDSWKNSKRGEE